MNPKKLQKSVRALSGWRESAFILALAERALPNTMLFLESINAEPLDAKQYPHGLSSLMQESWQALIFKVDEEMIVNCLDSVVESTVGDEFDSYGAQPCNQCLLLWEQALLGGLNNEKRRAPDASQQSLDTVTGFIEFSEGDGLSENQLIKLFDKHDLVQREMSFQDELCDILRSAPAPSKELINEIRELARDEGVSNIGICLED